MYRSSRGLMNYFLKIQDIILQTTMMGLVATKNSTFHLQQLLLAHSFDWIAVSAASCVMACKVCCSSCISFAEVPAFPSVAIDDDDDTGQQCSS